MENRMEEFQENGVRHDNKEKRRIQMLRLRNILNTIFILGAVAGMAYYFFKDENIGTIIILVAMGFKITETSIRLLKI